MLLLLFEAVLRLTGCESNHDWVSGGLIAIFIFSTLDVWLLLVEILRANGSHPPLPARARKPPKFAGSHLS